MSRIAPQFLYLSTTGWKSGRKHRVEIWFIESDGHYYVMSERKKKAHWIQNIIRNCSVSFNLADKKFGGSARIIDTNSGNVASKAAGLMKEKYGWNEGLIVELTPGS